MEDLFLAVFGLPLHPLAVHFAVVLFPLSAVVPAGAVHPQTENTLYSLGSPSSHFNNANGCAGSAIWIGTL